jgi:preprotein translocase subunit SecY
MENKQVGWLVIGIAIVMAIMVLIFNNLIKSNIGLTCSHGPTCEMYTDLNIQTWISLSIVAVVFIIGLVILFSKPREKIIVKHQTKTIKEKIKPINKAGLEEKEKTSGRNSREGKCYFSI